jgi:membrane protease YdiL (CAAX protease family)
MLLTAGPVGLYLNRSIDPGSFPLGWELLGASFKAGVVEELGNRFFLITLFVWIGGFLKRDQEGRPTRDVYWGAILLAGLLFGWAHVDAQLGNPTITFGDYGLLMVLNSSLGIFFGWLYWKLGLEWAIFAHFAYDAVISMVLIPLFLL